MVVRVDARVAACSIPPPNRLVLGPDASLLDLAAFEQALETLLDDAQG